MRTLLTPTPVGPIAASSTVLILAADRKNRSLSTTRAQVTRKLATVELPACFVESTAAAQARLLAKPVEHRSAGERRELKRISRKVRKLEVLP